jgi:mRNA-degrading endonuclease RelE of RelBE toxin-antitoxin system
MITFTPTPVFNKNVKRLAKRYPSFVEDLRVFLKDLEENPEQGTSIGEFRKIRMAITSKAKGKSGGARVITVNCLVEEKEGEVFLVTIYDKSQTESITKKEMKTAYNSLKK